MNFDRRTKVQIKNLISQHQESSNLSQMQASVDDAARHVQKLFFTFLLFCFYVAVIVFSTTDEQLLRESNVTLPLLNVGLPIVGFYILVPWLVVLFHLNLLLQFNLLSGKLYDLDGYIKKLPVHQQAEQRRQMFPLLFSHMLVGVQEGRLVQFLLRLVIWVSITLFPIALLFIMQMTFVRYHSEIITWTHRLLIGLDLGLFWFLWLRNLDGNGHKWRQKIKLYPQMAKAAFGATLLCVWLSFYIAAVPGGGWQMLISLQTEERLVSIIKDPQPKALVTKDCIKYSVLWWIKFIGYRKVNRFLRNYKKKLHTTLTIDNVNLLSYYPPPEVIAHYLSEKKTIEEINLKFGIGFDLSNRDFKGAYFRNVQLFKSDLGYSNFQNALFYQTDLQSASITGATFQSTTFQKSNLQGANLAATDFMGTSLWKVNLRGTVLQHAKFQGAYLQNVNFQGAYLQNVNFQGAILHEINFEGANLAGANFQGANLVDVSFQGANLRKANFQGAFLRKIIIGGTDLTDVMWHFTYLENLSCRPYNDWKWKELLTEFKNKLPEGFIRDNSIRRIKKYSERKDIVFNSPLSDCLKSACNKNKCLRFTNKPPLTYHDIDAYEVEHVKFLVELACTNKYIAKTLLHTIRNKKLIKALHDKVESCPTIKKAMEM